MPKMDGIETTAKIRKAGYTKPIIALTANALIGNDKMFKQNGFDGFIAKPIDIRELNAALNTFVRDKHPEESKKYKGQAAESSHASSAEKKSKLLQIFCRDAEKAAVTLRETVSSNNIKLFTTTAHAMKSALANVGESEISDLAAQLEKAGINGDTDYIHANTENFVKELEKLIQNLAPKEIDDNNTIDITEDLKILNEQLQIIKTACENYDDNAVYAALNVLKEKTWKPQTAAALEEIYDLLFLHSDFEGAAEKADKMINISHQIMMKS
jgi:DNA-binding response OmpR family regulator